MPSRRALITGGSRGIGAATVLALAEQGFDVAFTYRSKQKRAADVAARAARFGHRVLALCSDMTKPEDLAKMAAAMGGWASQLDVLVLNASGGLERELTAATPDYAMRINRDAQVATVRALTPLLSATSLVVFVTSHWAHRYGEVIQLPAYEPIAESKHAGERALRELLCGQQHGARLVVITGDLVEGTTTPKLLERVAEGMIELRRREAGALPTVTDMAAAVAWAATGPTTPCGHVIVVGGALDTMPTTGVPARER